VGLFLVRELTAEERERCRAYLAAEARARLKPRRSRLAPRMGSRRLDARLSAAEIAEAWIAYEASSSLRGAEASVLMDLVRAAGREEELCQ
jgi:hypothetical protein